MTRSRSPARCFALPGWGPAQSPGKSPASGCSTMTTTCPSSPGPSRPARTNRRSPTERRPLLAPAATRMEHRSRRAMEKSPMTMPPAMTMPRMAEMRLPKRKPPPGPSSGPSARSLLPPPLPPPQARARPAPAADSRAGPRRAIGVATAAGPVAPPPRVTPLASGSSRISARPPVVAAWMTSLTGLTGSAGTPMAPPTARPSTV